MTQNIKVSVITPSIRPEGLKIVQECLKRQTHKNIEWIVELGLGTEHDFNKAMNRALKRATGELVVIYQDFIQIPDNGIEMFVKEHDGKTFMTSPLGKVMVFGEQPRWDWRNVEGAEMAFQGWEIDWGACPLQALKDIGGFDEELDGHWSCDNLNVAYRAFLAGYTFKLVQDNNAVAIDHDKIMEHPFRAKYDPSFNDKRMRAFESGFRLCYLDSD